MSSLSRFSREIGNGINLNTKSSEISEENKKHNDVKMISKKKKRSLHGVALGFGDQNVRNSAPSLEIKDDDMGRVAQIKPQLKNVQTSLGGKISILGEIQEEGQNDRSFDQIQTYKNQAKSSHIQDHKLSNRMSQYLSQDQDDQYGSEEESDESDDDSHTDSDENEESYYQESNNQRGKVMKDAYMINP